MDKIDLKFLGSCPVCASSYDRNKTSIVDKFQENITLHIECARWGSSVLVSINAGLRGLVTTVGMPTDLSKSDLKRLKKATKVTTDEVLELHMMLEQKNKN